MCINLAANREISLEEVKACNAVKKLHHAILMEYKQNILLVFDVLFEK